MEKNRSLRLPLVGAVSAAMLLAVSACGVPEDAKSEEGAVHKSTVNDVQKSADMDVNDVQKSNMGLGADHSFRARGTFVDERGHSHVRYDHFYRGVRVWQGDTIVHNTGTRSTTTGNVMGDIHVSTAPGLTVRDALAYAHRDLQPRGPYARQPTAELVIYPQVRDVVSPKPMRGPGGELNAIDVEQVIDGYTLAYYVHTELENGTEETLHTDYLIDAKSGTLLKKWNALQTAAAIGTGYSEYSGTVQLGTNSIVGGYELRDVARGMNFSTNDLAHGTSGTGTVYTDADNIWGDGANYSGGSTTSANGQTAAVDAHYGVAKTYDYYYYVHYRNGIDGIGTATYSRVHYYTAYDNAFWSDSCFCMTYGDGSYFKVLTSLDVAGHEMSHGVTSRTAGLTYSGESGGLNESMSDIGGTMVEFYARGGSGSTIGNSGGNWLIGDQLNATPLRYMYKPSKDGRSPDAWYSGIGGLDVHYSSGPMNRAFYFLSQGASNVAGDYYSAYLPGGMTGIGNDHAARIQFQALAGHMNSATNYAGARTAFLEAANDLYGASSADYAAVENAFAAINVGSAHVDPPVTQLYNGVPVAGLSGALHSELYYKITVPAGQTNLTVQIGAMTGDADLYVKYGSLPSLGTFDCRPYYGSGSAETCTFNNPAAGDWYVMIRGWAAYSGVTLTAYYSVTLKNGISVPNIADVVGGQLYYKISVPAGQANLTVQISAMTGDADLYVKYGALPTTSTFDCRPYIGGSSGETCTFASPAAGDWWIMIRGWTAYSAVALTATYWANLTDGVGVPNLAGAAADQLFYKISVPAGETTLTVQISPMTGDADLYVKYGVLPSTTTFDCRPFIDGSYGETCTFTSPAAGDWYVMVRGWTAFSNVTLTADYAP